MGSLLNADPLAGPGCVARACGPGRGPSPGPHAACLSPLGCLKACSSPLVICPVAQACSFLSDHLPWCPAASSPPVSGCFLSACLRPVPLDRLAVNSSRLVSDPFLSPGYMPVPLSLYPAGGSRLLPCRFFSAGFRSVRLGWRPAVPSLLVSGMSFAACFQEQPRAGSRKLLCNK